MRKMLNEMVCATSFRFALFSCLLAGCASATAPSASLTSEALVGTWEVSLFYSPTESPGKTQLVVTGVEDGLLKGSFYDSEFFEASRVTQRGETIAFTGITTDGNGDYTHSGRLVSEDVIDGQTLAPHRNFLMIWRAERTVAAPDG